MTYRCDVPCQSTHFADAWALFIDCIGGPLAAAFPPKQAPRPAAVGS
jgi:hypothetical protein